MSQRGRKRARKRERGRGEGKGRRKEIEEVGETVKEDLEGQVVKEEKGNINMVYN